MTSIEPKAVIVSRNGEVHTRTISRRLRPFLGTVLRDPASPKRWLAQNEEGLPIATPVATRAEAVENLAEYVEHTVLEAVPVSQHVGITTEPIEVVTDNDPERGKRAATMLLGSVATVLGLGTVTFAVYGILVMS